MDDLRSRLEQALAGTYVFQRELGGGGMSRTYLATEAALSRRVVVKVLAPELLAGISVERFRREVLLAAQLQHPHVVPVLTAGEAAGLPWFSMPYVEGESLRQRLATGPLAIGEVMSILRDVARALAYAHAHGIVHRDIKPDNVLLSGRSATVTDFGIAKAISAARTDLAAPNATLTQAGSSIGTPTYMAPEQAVGDPDTDHRADLYAFGAMAYELLAGQPPFTAATPAKLVAAHLGETPRDVRVHRPDTPAPLAALVMRCLAKDPAARPADAEVLVRELEVETSSGGLVPPPPVLRGGHVRTARALAIWAAAAAAMVVTAWAATEAIGLPSWALPGAVGLALAGLPVILATAFVHRTAYRAYTATPTLTPGGSAAPPGAMATLALKVSPHVSWRRTWFGGGVAVAAFALLVIGFMVTRALGIGPAASLRGTGAFGDEETLVVADFQAPPRDSLLGPTVSEALRTDLGQSRTLKVMTRATVREVLRRMLRDDQAVVPFDVAREIATREGAKAVLDGSVVQLGQGYVVSARLVSALDGGELATFRETARDPDDLIDALGRLSRAVREKAGESLRGIRQSIDIQRVSTPSLAALRKYVEGQTLADDQGEFDRGLALLREAVALDSGFAMAWRKIAVLLSNAQASEEQVFPALEAAYRHRDRLTDLERMLTEGFYFQGGPAPDEDRALAAYEQALQLDSMLRTPLNNSALIYMNRRDYARAEAQMRRVARLPGASSNTFTNLIVLQLRRGDSLAVDSTAAEFRRRFPDSRALWLADVFAATVRDDAVRTDSIARAAYAGSRDSRVRSQSAQFAAEMADLSGRPGEALLWWARMEQASVQGGVSSPAHARFLTAIDSALALLAIDGTPSRALDLVRRAQARVPPDSLGSFREAWEQLARFGALAQDPAVARAALDGARRYMAAGRRDSASVLTQYEGWAALAEQQWDRAAGAFAEADRQFVGKEQELIAWRGMAHDRAGRADSALAAYEAFVGLRDPQVVQGYWRPRLHRRAGELREQRGDRAAAIRHHEAFLRYWQDAEPALQPQVRDVRERLARLRAQAG